MANEQIQEGFEVFVSDVDKPFGAVRQAASCGKDELVIYVENAGEFTVALGAVKAVPAQKVMGSPLRPQALRPSQPRSTDGIIGQTTP